MERGRQGAYSVSSLSKRTCHAAISSADGPVAFAKSSCQCAHVTAQRRCSLQASSTNADAGKQVTTLEILPSWSTSRKAKSSSCSASVQSSIPSASDLTSEAASGSRGRPSCAPTAQPKSRDASTCFSEKLCAPDALCFPTY